MVSSMILSLKVCVLAHVPVPVKVGRDHENKSMRTCESQRISLCVSPCLPACLSRWLVPLLTNVPSCRSSAETKSPFYGFWRSELRSLLFVWQVIYQLSHLPSSFFFLDLEPFSVFPYLRHCHSNYPYIFHIMTYDKLQFIKFLHVCILKSIS